MAIADDISVAANGDIRRTGDAHGGASPGYYTVLELHRFLGDLADDGVASGDDLADITSPTPSVRSTDNVITLNSPYNIDDDLAQYLYDGEITQNSGNTVYSGLEVVGTTEAGTNLQVVQDNALLTNYWGTGLNTSAAENILLRILVKTRENGVNIDGKRLRVQARELGNTYAEFSLTMGSGKSVAAIFTSSDLNNQTAAGTIAGWTSIVNAEGLRVIDLNNGNGAREYYSEWDKGSQTINELYERTKWIQRRGTSETIHGMNGELFRGPTHSFAYDGETGGAPATNDNYAWGLFFNYDNESGGPFTVGEALTIGSAKARLLALDDNGLTGSMVVAVESGTPADNDTITGLSSSATADVNGTPAGASTGGGVMTLLAVDDDGATGNLYVQLIKGTAPSDNTVLYKDDTQTAQLTVNGSVTSRTVSPEFLGQSTGSAIIGAYGIGIESADLSSSDQLFDLTNTQQTPPNNVTFTVSGLVSGEDRVLVGPEDGAGGLEINQDTVNGALLAGATSIVTTGTIPSDTPASGTVRVFNGTVYDRIEYSSYTGSTYTVDATAHPSGIPNAIANGANIFISYIDELASAATASFTTIYSSDRDLFIRVRDGGITPIVTYEAKSTLGNSGGNISITRTSDA